MMATATHSKPTTQIDPLTFFGKLRWIDLRPLLAVIEPYRQRLFQQALYTFTDDGVPQYNLMLAGRSKKNWKSADLILAALYRCFAWRCPGGNQAYVVANDEGQASDNLTIAKLLVRANPVLAKLCTIRKNKILRKDGKGFIEILPAKDISGAHGKTYCFIGFDEIHEHRSWDLLEALQPDPFRADVLQWFTSYASLYHKPGVPLFDMCQQGWAGQDPRMLFSWYAGDKTSDPDFADCDPETRANPSKESWADQNYLDQQRSRLPSHKFRRLHLNLPGLPEGSPYQPEVIMDSVARGIRVRLPEEGIQYAAFVDMSGGSNDDAVLGIGYRDADDRAVLARLVDQGQPPPFDPRKAVARFAPILKALGIFTVEGDRYAGQTFIQDFQSHGIHYQICPLTKSQLYEALEPRLNSRQVILLDEPKLEQQLLGLAWRGGKIDHLPGEHDDYANACAGLVHLLAENTHPELQPGGVGQRACTNLAGENWEDLPTPGLPGMARIRSKMEMDW
jgi:hypothetical protein